MELKSQESKDMRTTNIYDYDLQDNMSGAYALCVECYVHV